MNLLDPLKNWTPPYVSEYSFASIINELGGISGPALSASDLNALVKQLDSEVRFSCGFHPASEIVTTRVSEPLESDFKCLEEFYVAHERWGENEYDPKPWLKSFIDPNEIKELLCDSLKWTINNKRYPVPQLNGTSELLAFSRKPAEKSLIEQLEFEHQFCVSKFASNIQLLFSDSGTCELYTTNHLLDINDSTANKDGAYDCFFDETVVLTDRRFYVLLWVGHERWYG